MIKFQKQVKLTTGLDVKNPDWVKEAEVKKEQTAMAPDEAAQKSGAEKMKEVKGYEMKEKKEEKATRSLLFGSLADSRVCWSWGIVAVIGRGLWKGMKQR